MKLKIAILFCAFALMAGAQPDLSKILIKSNSPIWESSDYGPRFDVGKVMGGNGDGYHTGIDIACKVGTKVLAIADGIVLVCAFNDPVYGRYMVIRTKENYDILYGHLSETWYKKGQQVAKGMVIGLSGNTGQSTGPHLHLGIFIDPEIYLKENTKPTIVGPPKDWELRK